LTGHVESIQTLCCGFSEIRVEQQDAIARRRHRDPEVARQRLCLPGIGEVISKVFAVPAGTPK
jgi:hypothetical protein